LIDVVQRWRRRGLDGWGGGGTGVYASAPNYIPLSPSPLGKG